MSLTLIIAIVLVVLVVAALVFIKLNSGSGEEVLPYRLKKFFFSKSEQEFFRLLEASIDHQKYSVFPKVRLADFIETISVGEEKMASWNSIRSKHIDFLIWDIEASSVALAIELDGRSHNSEHMQKSDDFKDRLFPALGLELVRINVGTNFQSEILKTLSKLEER